MQEWWRRKVISAGKPDEFWDEDALKYDSECHKRVKRYNHTPEGWCWKAHHSDNDVTVITDSCLRAKMYKEHFGDEVEISIVKVGNYTE